MGEIYDEDDTEEYAVDSRDISRYDVPCSVMLCDILRYDKLHCDK